MTKDFWKFCPFLVNFVLIGNFVLICMTHLHFLLLLPLLTTSLLVSSLPHLPPFPTRHYLFTTLHFTYLHLVIANALLRLHYISQKAQLRRQPTKKVVSLSLSLCINTQKSLQISTTENTFYLQSTGEFTG